MSTLQRLGFVLVVVAFTACERPEAYVECKSAGPLLATGMTCTLDHRAGSKPLHVCWTMNVQCSNGAAATADGCGDVEPKGKSSVLMPYSAFGGRLDKCDQASGASVTGLKLSER